MALSPSKPQQQRLVSGKLLENYTWRLLRFPAGACLPDHVRSSSPEAAQAVINTLLREFWESERQRVLTATPALASSWIPFEHLSSLRVPGAERGGKKPCSGGQKYLGDFMNSPAIRQACLCITRGALLLWGWAQRRASVRVYGVFLPRLVLLDNSPADVLIGKSLYSCLQKQFHISASATSSSSSLGLLLSGENPLPYPFKGAPHEPLRLSDDYQAPPLEWCCSPTTTPCFHWSSKAYPEPQAEFRADYSDKYLDTFKCLQGAAVVMEASSNASLAAEKAIYDRVAVSYLLLNNLSTADGRAMDLAARTLSALMAFRLILLDLRYRAENKRVFAMDAICGEKGLGVLRALATQEWLRYRYIHQRDEEEVLQAVVHQGGSNCALIGTKELFDPMVNAGDLEGLLKARISLIHWKAVKLLPSGECCSSNSGDMLTEYPMPTTAASRKLMLQRELHRFMRDYRGQCLELPNWIILVPAADLDHSSPIPGIGGPAESCMYRTSSICGINSLCTVCKRPGNIYRDASGQLWRCLHYAEVPMWQFGCLLGVLRRLGVHLKLTQAGGPAALDDWMAQVGLRQLWQDVQDEYSRNCREEQQRMLKSKLGAGAISWKPDYEMIEKDVKEFGSFIREQQRLLQEKRQQENDDDAPVVLASKARRNDSSSNSGNSSSRSSVSSEPAGMTNGQLRYDSGTIDRIKSYIAMEPERFYAPFKGYDYKRMGNEIRWGSRNSFAVAVGTGPPRYRHTLSSFAGSHDDNNDDSQMPEAAPHPRRQRIVAGNFSDFTLGIHGDAIKFIMIERYCSDNTEGFRAALLFCHAWVLRTYGLDALERDLTPKVALGNSVSARISAPPAPLPLPPVPMAVVQDSTCQSLPNITAQLIRPTAAADTAAAPKTMSPEEQRRVQTARTAWNKATVLKRDCKKSKLVLDYLIKSRNIQLEHLFYEQDSLRFLANFVTTENGRNFQYPAMLSGFVDPVKYPAISKEIYAVQGTCLNQMDSAKAKALDTVKKTHGFGGNHFVPINIRRPRPLERSDGGPRIFICEGVESGASVAEACPELDGWVCGGIGNVGNFPLGAGGLSEDIDIIYCADWDGPGAGVERMNKQVGALRLRGWRVHLAIPGHLSSRDYPSQKKKDGKEEGTDFNTILQLVKPRKAALQLIRQTVMPSGNGATLKVYEPLQAEEKTTFRKSSSSGGRFLSSAESLITSELSSSLDSPVGSLTQ